VISVPDAVRVRVGSLGVKEFKSGLYAYVGSAMGGVEQRVARHASGKKKRHWHIDYLLSRGRLLSAVAFPADRKTAECGALRAIAGIPGASVPVAGFGSSDCRCPAHLVYFGDADPEWVAESVAMAIAMLGSAYPRVRGRPRRCRPGDRAT